MEISWRWLRFYCGLLICSLCNARPMNLEGIVAGESCVDCLQPITFMDDHIIIMFIKSKILKMLNAKLIVLSMFAYFLNKEPVFNKDNLG